MADPKLAARISNLFSQPSTSQIHQGVLRLQRKLFYRLSTGKQGDPKDLTEHLVVKRNPVLFLKSAEGKRVQIATSNSLWFQPKTEAWIPAGTRIKYFDKGGERITNAEKERREDDYKGGYCMKDGNDMWYDSYRIRGTCLASMANSPFGVVDAAGLPVSANCIYCGTPSTGYWLQAIKGIYALPQKNGPPGAMILVDYQLGPKEFPAEAPKGYKPPRPNMITPQSLNSPIPQSTQFRNMDKSRNIASHRQDIADTLSLSMSQPPPEERFTPMLITTTLGRVTVQMTLQTPPPDVSLLNGLGVGGNHFHGHLSAGNHS
jgi:hypothetical protein